MRIIIEIDAEEKRGVGTMEPRATVTTVGEAAAAQEAMPGTTTGTGEVEPMSAGPAPALPEEEGMAPDELAAGTAATAGPAPEEPDMTPQEETALRAGEAAGGLSAGAAPGIVE